MAADAAESAPDAGHLLAGQGGAVVDGGALDRVIAASVHGPAVAALRAALLEGWGDDVSTMPGLPATDGVWCAYDDLFLLRYILSFKTVAAAAPAVRACVARRASPGHRRLAAVVAARLVAGAMTRAARSGPPADAELEECIARFYEYHCSGPLPRAQPDGGETYVIRAGRCDLLGLRRAMSHAECVSLMVLHREHAYFHNDAATRAAAAARIRERGGAGGGWVPAIAKWVILLDMTGAHMGGMMAEAAPGAPIHDVSVMAQYLYPQLQVRAHGGMHSRMRSYAYPTARGRRRTASCC